VVVQFLLQTTSVPGAPFGAGNTLAFMVNNGSLLIPIQVQGMPYFELNVNCPGPNIFLWTGAPFVTGHSACRYYRSLRYVIVTFCDGLRLSICEKQNFSIVLYKGALYHHHQVICNYMVFKKKTFSMNN